VIYGEIHQEVIDSHKEMVSLYRRLGEEKKEIEQHMKILEIRRRLYGEGSHETALSYFDVAKVQINCGDYRIALKYISKTLAIYRKILRENPEEEDHLSSNIDWVKEHLVECQQEIECCMKVYGTDIA